MIKAGQGAGRDLLLLGGARHQPVRPGLRETPFRVCPLQFKAAQHAVAAQRGVAQTALQRGRDKSGVDIVDGQPRAGADGGLGGQRGLGLAARGGLKQHQLPVFPGSQFFHAAFHEAPHAELRLVGGQRHQHRLAGQAERQGGEQI